MYIVLFIRIIHTRIFLNFITHFYIFFYEKLRWSQDGVKGEKRELGCIKEAYEFCLVMQGKVWSGEAVDLEIHLSS